MPKLTSDAGSGTGLASNASSPICTKTLFAALVPAMFQRTYLPEPGVNAKVWAETGAEEKVAEKLPRELKLAKEDVAEISMEKSPTLWESVSDQSAS